jgi:hypothetical protein
MKLMQARSVLLILDLSAAVSTILGGIAIVFGLDNFPREWLAGTPFSDYLIPGLILGLVVGGLAAIAAVATARNARLGGVLSVLAGGVLAGWIGGELVLLNQNGAASSPRSPVEAVFLLLGLVIVVLGLVVWRRSPRTQAD